MREPLVLELPDLPEPERLEALRRWQARARALGGHLWRISSREVGLVVPEGVPVRGGVPLRERHRPCTVAAGPRSTPAGSRDRHDRVPG